MKIRYYKIFIIFIVLTSFFLPCLFYPQISSAQDINVLLMESTFKIVGTSKEDPTKNVTGTVFIIGRPMKNQPEQAYYVLVTAAHVLNDISGDDAVIYLRKKESNGSFKKLPFPIKIRDKGKPNYVNHDNSDVAAMYIKIPQDVKIPLLSTNLLADDNIFEKYEIHPGDELLCLGYPLIAEANEAGFPILRSGKISSYPIIPAKTVKTFLFDFNIFGGNSGGPVYMSYKGRIYGHIYHIDEIVQYIAGLVSQQANALPEFNNQPLALAIVVPAQFIKETINLLPENP